MNEAAGRPGPSRSSLALAAVAGSAYGLGLARYLFERFPVALGALGHWPATVALVSIVAVATMVVWWAIGWIHHQPPLTCLAPLALPLVSVFTPEVNLTRSIALLVGGAVGAVALCAYTLDIFERGSARSRELAVVTGLVFITGWLYLRTLAPTVGEADTFEFQVNSLRLAIAHPSGYPLYILIGKLFSALPLGGSAAWRINLSSAATGIAAVAALYCLGLQLGARRPAAALASLTFGVSFGLWSRAVEAEVYPLHAAFVATILWLLLELLKPGKPNTSIGRIVLRLAFLAGLAFTNHLTTALLAPAGLAALILGRPRLSLKTWLLAGTLFVLGLSVYLYIPLRWPAINHGETMTPRMFVDYVTGQQAQGALRPDAWLTDASRYNIVGQKALLQFGWSGAALAGLGLGYLTVKRRAAAVVLALAYASFTYFAISFYVPDPDFSAFLVPAHLVQAALMGVGLTALLTAARLWPFATRSGYSPRAAVIGPWSLALIALYLVLPLSLIWTNLPKVDKSRSRGQYELGQYIMQLPLAPRATILADSEKIAPLFYLQVAEGVRRDLNIMVLPDEAAYRSELDARLAAGQAVYLGRYLPHLGETYHLRSVGPLTEASATPFAPEQPPVAVDTAFGKHIKLIGVDRSGLEAPAGEPIRLTLYWTAVSPPERNYLVRLRLVDRAGRQAMATPGEVPVNDLLPTTLWTPGAIVSDFHTVPLDYSLTPGDYALQVGLFPPFSAAGLPADDGSPWQTVGAVAVGPPAASPAIFHDARFRFVGPSGSDGLVLIGWNAPEAVAPGTPVRVSLFWLPQSKGVPGAVVRLVQLNPDASATELSTHQLLAASWPEGTAIETTMTFTAPREAGEISLGIDAPGWRGQCGWLGKLHSSCRLAALSLEGQAAAPGTVNFDNQILLRQLELETKQANPGQVVQVRAEWQSLRAMETDYTVFVHLIGPDGLLYGQVDIWPGQGTRPTSAWRPGDVVTDRFEIRLADNAPPGDYTVEAGWYLLATLQRLPVIGESGAPVDDKVLQVGLTVR